MGAGAITLDQASEYKVYALFGSSLLPTKYQSDVPIPMEGTDSLIFALKDWNQLNAQTQQDISDFLTPKDPASFTPTATSTPSPTETSSAIATNTATPTSTSTATATDTPTPTSTSTATSTATSTPSSTPTATRTSTPTVTPTQSYPQRNIVGCTLDRQYGTPQGHFVIWYASGVFPNVFCTITGVTNTLTFLQDVGNGLEDGYTAFIQQRGYQTPSLPLPYQVYAVPLVGLDTPAGVTSPPGIIFINRQYSSYSRVVAAHEFFHSVQMSYFQSCMLPLPNSPIKVLTNGLNEDLRWWMEASAQWSQHEAVPADKEYFFLLGDYLKGPWKRLDLNEYFNVSPAYARFIFATFLAERYQVDTIRQTWEKYQQIGNCGPMMPALQSVLQSKGTTMEQVMPAFAEANYSLAYQSASDFRNTPIWGVGADGRPNADVRLLSEQLLFVTGPQQQYGGKSVEHLGAAYIEFVNTFAPPSVGRALTITADLYVDNPSITPTVKFWAITQYTPTVISKTIIPDFQFITQTGSTKHYVAKAGVPGFDGYKWVTMMLVNPQTSGSNMTYTYSAGVIGPAVVYAGGRLAGSGSPAGWISRDGGASWRSYTFSNSVQAVAAVTNTQGLVGYMGTSDLKLWKTVDGGQTFSVTQDFAIKTSGYITNAAFSLIQVDPSNTNTIYVGLLGSGAHAGKGGLYKSTDSGATFGSDLLADCHRQYNPSSTTDCMIRTLAIDPHNSTVLWIAQSGGDQYYQALMRSGDGGQTWQSKLTDYAVLRVVGIPDVNSNVIWVLSKNGCCDARVSRSTDAGSTWITTTVPCCTFQYPMFLPDRFNSLAAWEDTGAQLKRTTDGDVTWTTLFSQFDFQALGQLGVGRLYGTRSGVDFANNIQWSIDDGATWFVIGDPAMSAIGSNDAPQLFSVVGYGGGIIPNLPAKIQPPKNPLYP